MLPLVVLPPEPLPGQPGHIPIELVTVRLSHWGHFIDWCANRSGGVSDMMTLFVVVLCAVMFVYVNNSKPEKRGA